MGIAIINLPFIILFCLGMMSCNKKSDNIQLKSDVNIYYSQSYQDNGSPSSCDYFDSDGKLLGWNIVGDTPDCYRKAPLRTKSLSIFLFDKSIASRRMESRKWKKSQ